MATTHRKAHITHGHSRVGKKTPEYNSWRGMIWRCNPKSDRFADYGGRGIKVCERWRKFNNFLADMGPKPSPSHQIERRENNGDYEPSNCYWATPTEQGNNKRNNRLVTFGERTMSIQQWEKHLGFPRSLLRGRLRLGWSVEKAITTPPRQ